MTTDDLGRRTWWCRVADELSVLAEIDTVDDRVSPTDGRHRSRADGRWQQVWRCLLVRRARRHVARCARCRADRAEWARIVARLQETRRLTAPESVWDGVMARITRERPEHRPLSERPHAHDSDRATAAESVRDDEWLIPVLALAIAGGFAVMPFVQLADAVRHVLGAARGVAGATIEGWLDQATELLDSTVSIGSPVVEHVLVAGAWCTIGWGITVLALSWTRSVVSD